MTHATSASKRSWPLVALALLSFVPGLGFFAAAVAVTWGLLTDRPRARLAVSIAAVGAVLQILAGVWLVVSMKDKPAMHQVLTGQAHTDLLAITAALTKYKTGHGRYPSTLQELVGYPIPTSLLNIIDHSAGLFSQRPYQYRVGVNAQTFTLFAVGTDGLPGTPDDIYPGDADSPLPEPEDSD